MSQRRARHAASGSRARTIAYFRLWATAPVTEQIEVMLKDAFPQYRVETVNVGKLLKRDFATLLGSLPSWAREYGSDTLRGRRGFREGLIYTPSLFRRISRLLQRRLESQTADIAFTFQWQSLFDARLPGTPHFVYTDHTVLANLRYAGFDSSRLPAPSWIEQERSIYRHADLIFTWSAHITRSLIEQYGCPESLVRQVLTGPVVRARDGLRNDAYRNKNILFVGIDWNRKGGPTLVEAFRLVLQQVPDARLTIVGCSPEIQVPNCRVVGRIPMDGVRQYFEEASLFCLPTTLEPFGTVFLEAFDHAIPVVATDIGAIVDFVEPGRTGFLVKPGDAAALAEKLVLLIEQPDLCRSLGEAGRELVRAKYDWPLVGATIRESVLPILRGEAGGEEA